MTPNQVTAVSATFTFAAIAAVAIVRPSIPVAIAVALALLIGYALDSADGQLARLRGGGTMAGEWLDHVTDSVKNFSLHLAVAISWFRFAGLDRARLLLIPLAYAVVAATLFFGMTLIDQMRRRSTRSKVVAKDDPNGPRLPAPVLPSLLVLPNDYGLLCLIFCTLAWTRGFELIYSALFVINVLYLAAAIRKWFREVKTL
jgi:phosphatidylglycerophosphate synthase